jgi:hypothetical protein
MIKLQCRFFDSSPIQAFMTEISGLKGNLMKPIGLILVFTIACGFPVAFRAQQQAEEGRPVRAQELAEARKFPDLQSSLPSFSKVKLVLDRKSYRRGDLIKLDVGLLLTNTVERYFPQEFAFRIYVKDLNGKSVGIKQVANVDRWSAKPFEKQAKTLLAQSNLMLVSCNSRSLVTYSSAFALADLDDSVELFDKNLFAMPVGTCLEINGGAVLDVIAEVYNNELVMPHQGDSTKTLVGSVRSPSVQIRIEK